MWDRIEEFHKEFPEDFPVKCLPPILCNYAQAVAESTQTSTTMAAIAILGVVSACVAKKFNISPNVGYTEPLNLYLLIIAAPAERKSAVLKMVTKPIYEYERQINEKNSVIIQHNIDSRDVINHEIDMLKKSKVADKMEQIKIKRRELCEMDGMKPIRLIADDITPEQLNTLLSENNGKMAVISAEGNLFSIIAGKYSNKIPNIDVFLKSHSGDFLKVDRRNRSEYLENPSLTLLLCVQKTVADEFLNDEAFIGPGLTARFLLAYPQSRIGRRKYKVEPVSESVCMDYKHLIKGLLEIKNESENIELSTEADNYAEKFFHLLEKNLASTYKHFQASAGKLFGATIRIAGILHCAIYCGESAEVKVSKNTMENAILIGGFFLENYKYTYSSSGLSEENNANLLADKLRNMPESMKYIYERNKYFTPANFVKLFRCNGINSTEKILPILKILQEKNFIKECQDGRWQINPIIIS